MTVEVRAERETIEIEILTDGVGEVPVYLDMRAPAELKEARGGGLEVCGAGRYTLRLGPKGDGRIRCCFWRGGKGED